MLMELFLISGVSGSGKTVFLKALEDVGYYCADNIPVPLLIDFISVIKEAREFHKIAVVIDIREKSFLEHTEQVIKKIEAINDINLKIAFLDAKNEILERRFSETRRRHPVDTFDLQKSFNEERKLLSIFKEKAHFIVDTSSYNNYDLRKRAEQFAFGKVEKSRVTLKIMSFGYKYGLPNDADIVFDMRFLPNPYYINELKDKTGNDQEVKKFIEQSEALSDFIKITKKLLLLMIDNFDKEGKNFISIAFGCTGGRHRSVYTAESFYKILKSKYTDIKLFHRDIEK